MAAELLWPLTYLGISVNKLETALENNSHVNYANKHVNCIFEIPRSNALSLSGVVRTVNHSLPSCADIQKTRSSTYTLPQPFIARTWGNSDFNYY
jgi:hypothetical protein